MATFNGMTDRWTDALIACALLAAMELQLALGHAPGLEVLAIAGAVALALPIVWRRSHPLAVAVAFAAASAGQAGAGGGACWDRPPPAGAVPPRARVFCSRGRRAPGRP